MGAAGNALSFVPPMSKRKSLETVWLQGFLLFGGDKRDRTADLLNTIQALSPYKHNAPPYGGSV